MRRDSLDAWRIALAGMVGMAVAMGIGRFVFTPLLPSMMQEVPLSASAAGLIASANYIGYLLGAVVAGGAWASGREHAIAIGSLFASAALAAAMGMGSGFLTFATIRFAAGVASAFSMVFLSTVVFARVAELGRDSLSTLNFAGVGIGIAASAIMFAALLAIGAPWQSGWYWSGALSLAGAFVVVLLGGRVRGTRRAGAGEPPLPWSRDFRLVTLAYGLFGLGYVVTATFLVAIVRESGEGRLLEAWVWLATGLAIIPSVWLWTRLAASIGLRSAFALGCVVEAAGVVASVSMDGASGPLLGGVLLGGTFIAITYMGLQMGRRLAADAPRRALAVMTAAFGVGQIVGPILAGYVAEASGDYVVASLGAAATLLAAAAVCWQVRV